MSRIPLQHKTNINDIEHDPNTSRQQSLSLEQIQTPKNLLARSGEEKEVEKKGIAIPEFNKYFSHTITIYVNRFLLCTIRPKSRIKTSRSLPVSRQ